MFVVIKSMAWQFLAITGFSRALPSRVVFTAFFAVFLTGCAAPKGVDSPVRGIFSAPSVTLAIEAAQDVNPDSRGRASPVVVRVYELSGLGNFNSADFLGLFEREQATLGATLVSRDEVQLRPSQSTQIKLVLKPSTRYIAVAAAFRDLERSVWRTAIEASATSGIIKVRLSGRTVRLEPM
jgi:type VI secretion system protein VasD